MELVMVEGGRGVGLYACEGVNIHACVHVCMLV